MNILQIGANKGNTDNDPVWKLCQENLPASLIWNLWFVEPNIKALKILKKNYKNAGFVCCKYLPFAVSNKWDIIDLYVDNDVPGNEGSQHCSLYKEHMYKMGHKDGVLNTLPVVSIPLNEILTITGDIDYLQIDTEGHDAQILLGANLKYVNIRAIEYEHIHLSANQKYEVNRKLEDNGYEFIWINAEDARWELV